MNLERKQGENDAATDIPVSSLPAKRPRDSNLELYRILVMLLVVAHHSVVNSGVIEGPISDDPLGWRSVFLLLFGAWGKSGINCFLMITGFYMCKSEITLRKFLKLFLEILFYRIVIAAIFWISGYEPFTASSFFSAILPVRVIYTGFTSAYLVFFLTIPFLNILLRNLNEVQHICLLCLCFFLYIFLGSTPFFSVTMNYVSWFITVYFFAAFIRLYPHRLFDNTRFWAAATAVIVLISAVSVVCCDWLGVRLHRNAAFAYTFVTDSNSFLAFATGFCSFLFFRKLRLPYNKWINLAASSAFGVLIIHGNSPAMLKWLWRDTLDIPGRYDSPLMPFYMARCVIGIYVLGACIDLLRIRWIETPFFHAFDSWWKYASDQLLKRMREIEKRLQTYDK